MADVKMTAKVSIEKVAHDSIRHILEKLANEHGLMINSISASWFDFSDRENLKFEIGSIEMTTTTRRK